DSDGHPPNQCTEPPSSNVDATATGQPVISLPTDTLTGGPPALLTIAADPTYRVGKLAAANRSPVSVKPDGSIAEATTLMLMNDFSQLPVMQSDVSVKG